MRFDVEPPAGHGSTGTTMTGREGLGSPGGVNRRKRRRTPRGRLMLVCFLVVGLGTWVGWAEQQPGGVSGAINGWVSHVRGDVAKVSADPDLAKARRYYIGQYKATNAYPDLSESDLAAVGVGVGVTVEWCDAQAVVIQGASGGGTASRLLLSGKDLGELNGKYDCPGNLAEPAPWKA